MCKPNIAPTNDGDAYWRVALIEPRRDGHVIFLSATALLFSHPSGSSSLGSGVLRLAGVLGNSAIGSRQARATPIRNRLANTTPA